MGPILRLIPRILRPLHTAWSIAGITLVAILLTELGFRIVFAIKDRWGAPQVPDPRVITDGYGGAPWPVQHFRELESLEERWQPYVYFRQKPFSGQTITIGTDGIRRTWRPPPDSTPPDDPNVVKVLILGGSSLWGFGARDDHTIPSLLARDLHRLGYRVELRNLAEIGHVSTQEVVALIRELQAGYRPDLVIFHDGVNDTTSALLENEAGVTTNEQNRRHEFNLSQSPGRLTVALISRLVKDSACYRFAQVIGRRFQGAPEKALRMGSDEDRRRLAAEVVDRYLGNVTIVEKFGESFGFRPLFFWQPVVFDKTRQTPVESEEDRRYAWAKDFFHDVYESIRESPQMARHKSFHDLSGLFDDSNDLVFIDYCHTTEVANEHIAAVMAREVEQVLQSSTPTAGKPAH
jgi:lysophospholipase L1-like esterase